MNENQQDSEPLIDDGAYQLLRNDSLLNRFGSNNFAALLEVPTQPSPENENLSQQTQQHAPQHLPPQQQQVSDIQILNDSDLNNMLFVNNGLLTLRQNEQDAPEPWDNLETFQSDTPSGCPVLEPVESLPIFDVNSSTSFIPDSTPVPSLPSLQRWPGQYDFQIFLPLENKDRNKWCFSAEQNKLYLCPNVAVPINVKLLKHIDASITITPVFKESRHRVHPVVPCFNCKSQVMSDTKEHLVMVEGQECDYKMVNERYVVSVPLLPPPPGEEASTLLVRLTCLTSCVGGPNRRPFSLVFTLHSSTGEVIGRQVLDLKCCKCPSRDMLNDRKAATRSRERSVESHLNTDFGQVRKRSAPTPITDEKKKRFSIKLEPGTEQRYKNIPVPIEYVAEIKRIINAFIARDFVKRNQPNLLLFSEDEI